jgi:hypothetical protein
MPQFSGKYPGRIGACAMLRHAQTAGRSRIAIEASKTPHMMEFFLLRNLQGESL